MMSTLEQKRLDASERSRVAASIRVLRKTTHADCISTPLARKAVNDLAHFIARNSPPKPIITLTDYWPGEFADAYDGPQWYAMRGDRESWTMALLLDGKWTDEGVSDRFCIHEHYGGPGQPFSRRPSVEFNGHSTLVCQFGGLDI